MNDTSNTPTIANAIRETCMLVGIRCKAFGTSQTDRETTAEVIRDKNASVGAARVVTSRLAGVDKYHRAIMSAQVKMRQIVDYYTMEWPEATWGLLPNANFEPLIAALGKAKRELFDPAIKDLENNVDTLITQIENSKGNLNIRVPTREELLSAYTVTYDFRPIPEQSGFRGLPPEVQAKLGRMVDRRVEQATLEAQENVLRKFITPVDNFINAMEKYDKRERGEFGDKPGRAGAFNNSIVGNIKELYDTLASFNVLGDSRFAELGDRLREVVEASPDRLREFANERAAAVDKAQLVKSMLGEWLK